MTFEEKLRSDLHDMPAPTLVPPHGLADTALRGARRRNRMQAVTIAGASVVAVAAAVPVVWAALPGEATPAGLRCSAEAPLPDRPPSDAWEYFDPLRYEIDASAVTVFRTAIYSTSRHFQVLELVNPTGDRLVTVTLYAAHGVVHHRTADALPHELDPATGEPTEPVHGEPAYWLPEVTYEGLPQGQGLAWQWTPGAWVLVTAAAIDPTAATPVQRDREVAELRGLAAQIAPLLEFGGGEPVTAPFAMTAPDCTRVSGTSLMASARGDGTSFTRFGLGFSTEGQSEATNPLLLPGDSAPVITVTADSGATPEDKPGSATSDVDGHPAYIDDGLLVAYGVDGFAFEISTGPTGLDPAAVFRTLQVWPGATGDPATWQPG